MTPAEATGQWVENFVIRHGLCPFAARPFRAGLTETITCAEEGIEACFIFAITQVQGFLDKKQAEVETTLLVFASSLTDFGEFLDFVATLEDALEEVGANELIQLAHFHPDYQFADVPANDSGNLTNRSPFPVVQLLRVASVAEAVAGYPEVELIPVNNVAKMRALSGRL